MKKIEPWRIVTVVTGLCLVAYLVHSLSPGLPRFRVGQHADQPSAIPTVQPPGTPVVENQQLPVPRSIAAVATSLPTKSASELAEERQQRIAKYLRTPSREGSGRLAIAVAVAGADRLPNQEFNQVLMEKLSAPGVTLHPHCFRPPFYTEGALSALLRGSTQPLDDLGLVDFFQGLVLAEERISFRTNGLELQNVITATAEFEVTVISVRTPDVRKSWTFSTSGAGFRQADAKNMAENRLLNQIQSDNKLRLDLESLKQAIN